MRHSLQIQPALGQQSPCRYSTAARDLLGFVKRCRSLPVRGKGKAHLCKALRASRLLLFRARSCGRWAFTKGAIVPTSPLPEHPSLEHLKSQAKLVRDLVRSGDEGALSMVGEFHPRLDPSDLDAAPRSGFKLSDAQLIIARMYGFAGWNSLRDHLNVVRDFSHTPLVDVDRVADDESFVALAALSYSDHGPNPVDRIERAHRMLQADPSIATGSIEAVATVGDHAALATALDRDPEAVNAKCGPNDWPPLLYATYSRIATNEPSWSAIETVKVLLDQGADPNAGFLWRGLVPPFTALTGAFGRGESDQPQHPDRFEIARLLLEAGADPNDGQTLYNNGIGGQNHDDPRHLELLVSYGLGTQQHGPWYRRLGTQLREPSELLYDELEAAAHRGRPKILVFLLDLGLDPDRPVGRWQKTPVRLAAESGHRDILHLLAQVGVDITLEPAEAFLGHVRSGTSRQIRALLAGHPGLFERLLGEHPGVIKNVTANRRNVLATLLDLGFDINARTGGSGTTALHEAAQADDVALARLLVEHGADPNVSDTYVDSTPWGWADYGHHADVAAFLHPLTDHGDSAGADQGGREGG